MRNVIHILIIFIVVILIASCKKNRDIIPPADVSNVMITDGDSIITLSWKDPSDYDLNRIEILYENYIINVAKSVQKKEIIDLVNGKQYDFIIRTIDNSGNKSKSVQIRWNLDYRNKVIGDYSGIEITTYWNGSSFNHDTSNVTMTLLKATTDSIVDLYFNQNFSSVDYSFKYCENNTFISTTDYHPPSLRLSNDTLFYYVQPGLGPYWEDCIGKKIIQK